MPRPGILIREDMRNPEFDSDARRRGIDRLSQLGELSYYAGELTGELGSGVLGVIASSALIHPEFYEAAADLRIVARYGVGFEKVNLQLATEHGVIITLAPEHIESVAEYAVTQWLATLKRVYTLNRNSHGGDYATICTYEASGTTLGVYGFGRIGQAVARLAKPLLGAEGRLLVYDIRADISQLAESFGAEAVDVLRELALNPTISLSSRAARRTLVSYRGGSYSVSDALLLLNTRQVDLPAQLSVAPDEALHNLLGQLGQAQVLLEIQSPYRRRVHARQVAAGLRAPLRLGLEHRRFGLLEQPGRAALLFAEQRKTDTRRHQQRSIAEMVGLGKRAHDTLGNAVDAIDHLLTFDKLFRNNIAAKLGKINGKIARAHLT